MTALYPQSWLAYLDILLVFLRLLGLFLLVPAFSHNTIPVVVKLILALSLSLAIYPIVKHFLPPLDFSLSGIFAAAFRETFVGLIMGFAAYVTFEAINLAAQFVGYQMGFGSAGLMDPQTHASVSVLVHLHGWLALMVFFMANMHHHVLQLFVMSFEVTHGLHHEILSNTNVLASIVLFSGKLFVLAVQMAAPLTVLVLVVNAALGVLARMLPQMNVLLFSFPLTMILGFCTLYLVAPELLDYFSSLLGEMATDMVGVVRSL